ncbi:MAG: twin transmembrane helix small protein [Alphaproteobacteria bacterium]|nr:twin transmembrane helix small protein [Alphaproteobacteria bacterium]MDP6517919.1 twin transmembrane helix small protein [Alphaproteobacteria bacterium]
MEAVFPMLIVIALAAVLVVLATGIIAMFRGGEFNRKYGNKLMRLRVVLQALAVLLMVLFVVLIKT